MNVIARARRMLLAPEDAWREIEQEPVALLSLLFQYALPLAAIGPAAFALSAHLLERPAPAHWTRLMAAGIALNFASVIVIAGAAWLVSRVCGGSRNAIRAFVLACYSATSVWIAAIAVLAPDRAVFAIVICGALMHSLYVFSLGMRILLKVPEDESGIATAIVITLALAAFGGLGWGLAFWV